MLLEESEIAKEFVEDSLENLAHWAFATEVTFRNVYLLEPSMIKTVDDAISVTATYYILNE